MKRHVQFLSIAAVMAVAVTGCGGHGGGGGGGSVSAPSTTHSVSLSWSPNHESGVNSAGGGYQVLVNGAVVATVPYVSGTLAPTSTTITLTTGTYAVTVRAYAALDSQGGVSGTDSAASLPITVNVP